MKSRVLVGISGGVDSSIAALILKRKGYEVTGAFMDLEESNSLKSKDAAKDIAKSLEIPFCIFNLREEFKKKIINNFIKEYQIGITPNPCVDCNKEVKFGLFYERALAMGFDYIATGHYARLRKNKDKELELLKGKDKIKDQSYFLWRLNQKQLSRIFFPLGDYAKDQVRLLAKKNNLPSAEREESQEVCFIKESVNDFLKEKIGEKEGLILDVEGKKIGKHYGLWFYTIGQRKGLNLSRGPYFVVDKKIEDNVLVVSKKRKDLLKKEMKVKHINWIKEKIPEVPLKIKVKIRYGHKEVSAEIYDISGNECSVIFDKPQKSIASGQSAVFYQGIKLIGGGKII